MKVHEFGLFLLVASLPISKFGLSVGQLLLVINWLLWGNIIQKFKVFFKNKTAVVITSVFLLHVLGLLYTSDFNYALKDLRIKLPLLALPVILSTSPTLNLKKTLWLGAVFLGAVLFGTFAGGYNLLLDNSSASNDIRKASVFISHIRFSLMICLLLAFLGFVWFKAKLFFRFIILFVMAWLVFYLLVSQSVTGVSVLLAMLVVLSIYLVFGVSSKYLKIGFVGFTILLVGGATYPVYLEWNTNFNVPDNTQLTYSSFSANGEEYYNNLNRKELENGHYVWVEVAWLELEKAWEQRSEIDFNALDNKNQPLHATLIRFMASKGLSKDSVGMQSISNEEIAWIENGETNIRFVGNKGLKDRMYKIIWEVDHYFKSGNPSGNSVMQRLEFWKAGIFIVKNNLWLGVGIGDVKQSFNKAYPAINTLLEKKYWLRAHNQYLSFCIAFGLLGLGWFLFSLVYPFLNFPNKVYFIPYLLFVTIACVSFVTEDTLETQTGVTFFAFFNTFLLFGYAKSNH